ncbi:hypothetical protein GGR52DRAFT_531663 [Hypoxylon sp. FL1284]|nr:hypothetical protein GGR52DRAFT_531663 [Hypoxylon sp. FL1284]
MAVRDKSSPVTMNRSQTFPLFAALPIELRLMIWTYNLPGPRVVDIKYTTESDSTSEPQQKGHKPPTTCIFTSSIPVNLRVCRESRLAALRRYRFLFRDGTKHGQVVFDPVRDTLYFGARLGIKASRTRFDTFVSLILPEYLSDVHRIAINDALISHNQSRRRTGRATRLTIEHILRESHRHFGGLEQLTFVCEDRNPTYSPDTVLVEPRVRDRALERQICEAVSIFEGRQSEAKAPPCNVRAIAAGPNPPEYNQGVLGYRGSRQVFFRHFQLPQIEKAIANYQWAIKA